MGHTRTARVHGLGLSDIGAQGGNLRAGPTPVRGFTVSEFLAAATDAPEPCALPAPPEGAEAHVPGVAHKVGGQPDPRVEDVTVRQCGALGLEEPRAYAGPTFGEAAVLEGPEGPPEGGDEPVWPPQGQQAGRDLEDPFSLFGPEEGGVEGPEEDYCCGFLGLDEPG